MANPPRPLRRYKDNHTDLAREAVHPQHVSDALHGLALPGSALAKIPGLRVALGSGGISGTAEDFAAGVMIVATQTRLRAGSWSQRGGFDFPRRWPPSAWRSSGPARAALPAAERLDEIPGLSREAAAGLIAEIGLDMSRFTAPEALVSSAGLTPGTARCMRAPSRVRTAHRDRQAVAERGREVRG
jgi:Transposase IS116/IS110/IS902 family